MRRKEGMRRREWGSCPVAATQMRFLRRE